MIWIRVLLTVVVVVVGRLVFSWVNPSVMTGSARLAGTQFQNSDAALTNFMIGTTALSIISVLPAVVCFGLIILIWCKPVRMLFNKVS